jgi:hypothetical protein
MCSVAARFEARLAVLLLVDGLCRWSFLLVSLMIACVAARLAVLLLVDGLCRWSFLLVAACFCIGRWALSLIADGLCRWSLLLVLLLASVAARLAVLLLVDGICRWSFLLVSLIACVAARLTVLLLVLLVAACFCRCKIGRVAAGRWALSLIVPACVAACFCRCKTGRVAAGPACCCIAAQWPMSTVLSYLSIAGSIQGVVCCFVSRFSVLGGSGWLIASGEWLLAACLPLLAAA